jgi:hypothetical protein
VQRDDGILVARHGVEATWNLVVARLTADGALDERFDDDGVARLDFAHDFARAVATQHDGRGRSR